MSRRPFSWPRPLDGWRRFAGEVGVIVLGVLIALVVQQVAQAVKDRSDAAGARDGIRGEIAFDLADLGNRARTQECIDRRLAEIEGLLVRAAANGGYAAPGWIGRPQVWDLSHARFDGATESGRASLLRPEEHATFADLYAGLESITKSEEREQVAWATLRGLEALPALSASEIGPYRAALQDAKLQNWRIRVNYTQSMEAARRLGIAAQRSAASGSQSVCLPIGTTRANALRRTGGAYGEP